MPPRCEGAFGPFDVLSRGFTMLFDQVPHQHAERLAFLVRHHIHCTADNDERNWKYARNASDLIAETEVESATAISS